MVWYLYFPISTDIDVFLFVSLLVRSCFLILFWKLSMKGLANSRNSSANCHFFNSKRKCFHGKFLNISKVGYEVTSFEEGDILWLGKIIPPFLGRSMSESAARNLHILWLLWADFWSFELTWICGKSYESEVSTLCGQV